MLRPNPQIGFLPIPYSDCHSYELQKKFVIPAKAGIQKISVLHSDNKRYQSGRSIGAKILVFPHEISAQWINQGEALGQKFWFFPIKYLPNASPLQVEQC